MPITCWFNGKKNAFLVIFLMAFYFSALFSPLNMTINSIIFMGF